MVGKITQRWGMGCVGETLRTCWRVVALCGLAVLTVQPAQALDRFVIKDNPGAAPPFTSWTNAAADIQSAISNAVAGDVIWVTNGVYDTGNQTWGSYITKTRVLINKNVTVRSVNGPAVTEIVGGGEMTNGPVRGVVMTGAGVLEGFTVRDGTTGPSTASASQDKQGGGIIAASTSVIRDCIIKNNTASTSGGGVSDGKLFGCVVTGNRSLTHSGGGTYWSYAEDCTITYNVSGFNGGGMYLGNGTPAATRCLIAFNEAPGRGGGVMGYGFYNYIANSAIIGNKANQGGGGSASMLNCTVAFNEAISRFGGVGDDVFGPWYYHNCIIRENRAPWDPNYDGAGYQSGVGQPRSIVRWCCLDALPTVQGTGYGANNGLGCITNNPVFLKTNSYRISMSSPCVGKAGDATSGTKDVDGDLWLTPAAIGADQPYPSGGLLMLMR